MQPCIRFGIHLSFIHLQLPQARAQSSSALSILNNWCVIYAFLTSQVSEYTVAILRFLFQGERGNKDQPLASKTAKKSSEKQFFDNVTPGQSNATAEPPKRPQQPNHGSNRNQQSNTRQAPVHMQNPQVQMSQNPYAGGQQYGMPYGQGYQGMAPGQYQAYLQAPYYPNFRPQMSYYGGSMMQSPIGENIGQQGVPPPPGHGSAAFSPSSPIHAKPAPVAREKRVRIF